ncbi:MAG: toll/interleukin-1 receptor domain-containing protein [Planctomycetaceae bacterium]|nr:toll/interleukin-1 receptor domain-containing protein [Planctomycetaceae bacterium]
MRLYLAIWDRNASCGHGFRFAENADRLSVAGGKKWCWFWKVGMFKRCVDPDQRVVCGMRIEIAQSIILWITQPAFGTQMGTVFISYSHGDADVADRICSVLDELKVTYFRDAKHIDWGKDIESEVRTALHNCAAIVVVVSRQSLTSPWVPYELGQGRALRKELLPFLTSSDLDLPLYLSRVSFVTSLDRVEEYFANFAFSTDASATARVLQTPIEKIADKHADVLLGTWTGNGHQQRGPDGHPIEFAIGLEITSADHVITGQLSISMTEQGRCYEQFFDVTGGFVGGRFGWLNYVAKKSDRPHFGTIILDLAKKQNELVAEYTGYGARTDGIVSGYARLIKDK